MTKVSTPKAPAALAVLAAVPSVTAPAVTAATTPARGVSGGVLAVNTYPGPQGGYMGGANRDTLNDDFFNRDSCFGLNSARGIFYFRFSFGDSRCRKAVGASFLLQTRF